MKPNTLRNLLIALLLFLGIGALGGGLMLIISPSGKLLGGIPVSILNHSPFTNFLIPGIVLFVVIGLAPCLVSIALIKKPISKFAEHFNMFTDMHWAWTFSVYVAFALVIWIQVETMFIQGTGWLQTFYMLYAIPILVVALLPKVRMSYKK